MGPCATKPRKSERKRSIQIFSKKNANIRQVYKFQSVLGHGSFGTVRTATKLSDQKGKVYAVKSIIKAKLKGDLKYLQNELDCLATLDHPSIIRFYETYNDEKYLHIVMEHCSGGELFERIIDQGRLDERFAANIMSQILSGLNHCHQNQVAHRDLKPENFLFESDDPDAQIKIIDFGLSSKFGRKEGMDTILGTPTYIAPEVLDGNYTSACDVWSVGVILYVMLCGYPPFHGNSTAELFRHIKAANYNFNGRSWLKVSSSAKDLIKEMLNRNPKNRVTAAKALEHKWFQEAKLHGESSINPEDSAEVLTALRAFNMEKSFPREAVRLLVNMFVSQDDLKNLKQAFMEIDKDNTGMITFDELEDAMKAQNLQLAQDEIHKIIEKVDYQGNGKINYTEFIAATVNARNDFTEEQLYSAFKHYDVDNTDFITETNIKEAFNRAGRKISDKEIKIMISEVDVTKDGKISFQEFQSMFSKAETQTDTS
eukprot:CAMPEP_0114990346 /NCGR_PEP_ID=MMETSP0216-20121206/10739_1 /TAXON_ID=223996 /ORGANISM="Protocruzia adherens, Strain Boccale" /LENGTH=483 /DNA_ID=CAMNT_0002353499 /DNA_START=1089 /DNA_END=2540 /DNA_ORIENTATION=-